MEESTVSEAHFRCHKGDKGEESILEGGTKAKSGWQRSIHLPRWLSGKKKKKKKKKKPAWQCMRCGFNPWLRKTPWRGKWQLTTVFLPGKVHGLEEPGRLQCMGSQSWTWLSTHLCRNIPHSLEKEAPATFAQRNFRILKCVSFPYWMLIFIEVFPLDPRRKYNPYALA